MSEVSGQRLPSTQAPADNVSAIVLGMQRQLRTRLLDNAAVQDPRARDLAAHMLLQLDDLPACWSVATTWLRSELSCQRVDTGFGSSEANEYFPGFAQAKDPNFDVPSFGGTAVYNRDFAMQAMWRDPRPVVFADIKQDSRFTLRLRKRMSGAKTKSKFGWALRTENGGFGLICADWTEQFAPWESGLYDCFERAVTDVLSPIIAVARDIADWRIADESPINSESCLTPSEIEVAGLVAQGMSYKEIARTRGRSLSTIDHQLRSIREKLGVPSTSALVSLLARNPALHRSS